MLDSIESSLIYFTGIFDIINIFLSIASFYFCNKRIFPHFNIKCLMLLLFFGILLQHIGQLIFMITVWKTEKIVLVNTINIDTIGRILTFFGVFSNRIILFLIGVERTVATIQLDSYEKRQATGFSVVLVSIWLLGTITLDYVYFLTKHISLAYITIVLTIDITAILTSISIRLWNQQLNKKRQNLNLSLTQRYQLAENLRLLKVQFPLVFTVHLLSILSATFMLCMNINFAIAQYHSLLFHAINAIFSTLYILITVIIFKRIFTPSLLQKRFWWCCFRPKENNNIHRIRNQYTTTTIDIKNKHFQMLHNAWN